MQMSNDQFQQLLKTITDSRTTTPPTPIISGSFSKCTARFNGKRCSNTVETFIRTTNIYKEIENISDADALKGLPLLLTDTAAVWWQGVQNEASTWDTAMKLIRVAFSPTKQAHQIYVEFFSTRQEASTPIDEFVCSKRALLAQLPDNRHDEVTLLDMVFGLLNINLRKDIPRDTIDNFADLLKRGREVELIQKENVTPKSPVVNLATQIVPMTL